MIVRSLDGAWQLREAGTGEWLEAEVPGAVHRALQAAGRIPDPFVADNELAVAWVPERDWEYRRTFVPDEAVLAMPRARLVFDGLDTLAEVHLNGEPLGRADNMFRRWSWDVAGRLRRGENELSVVFRSAVRMAAELHAGRPLPSANDQLPGAPYLRKAPCHFGWDWGPKLPNVGIWQPVRLEGWRGAQLADVRLETVVAGADGHVTARVAIERESRDDLVLALRLTGPDGAVFEARAAIAADADAGSVEVRVERPELWWPNGFGAQPLYRAEVSIERAPGGGSPEVLDILSYRVGFRTLELRQTPDEFGRSFTFVVNGVPVFAKGSNWIPAETFPTDAGPERLERLLRAAADGNQNMIRVWGGGYYETEAFYDLCDRLGLLVWHDFMFACSVYPLTDEAFVANVRQEVREQVSRLRHRTCLALLCGNNEMEQGWSQWGWTQPNRDDLREAYLGFFDETLPGWIRELDAATPYWPSSPSSGAPLVEPIGDRTGDQHQWSVWHGLEPFSNYTEKTWRFVSEFGFESLPAPQTVAYMAPDPADWDLGSPMLDHHQRSPIGNSRILYYLGQHFRLPKDFASLVYVSQLVQAEALRTGIEHWRRGRDRCSGTLYWQLDDCWPVVSWSTIDYFGRPKAAHYVTRRAYAPVLLSCATASDGSVEIHVTNDRPVAANGDVAWSVETVDGERLTGGRAPAGIPPCASARVAVVLASSLPAGSARRRSVVVAELELPEPPTLTRVVLPLVPDKHLELRSPRLDVAVEAGNGGEAVVTVRADTLARWVALSLDGADAAFEDGYFDVPAGREVRVTLRLPDGWDAQRARGAIRAVSLADTYR